MFTGLVEEVGTVDSAGHGTDGLRLAVAASLASGVAPGDSVAVDGLCLTVTAAAAGVMHFDVMGESLRRSTLGALAAGDEVNLERALAAGDRLGGHIVTGHVDGVGEVTSVTTDGFARVVRIALASPLLAHVVEKGSVCVAGVSLTVASVDESGLSVSLIPETLERTTLGSLDGSPAARLVNVETDILAKHAEKLVAATLPSLVEQAVADRLRAAAADTP